jgi:hypothetical protein
VYCTREDDHGGRSELVGEVEQVRVFLFQREEKVVLKKGGNGRVPEVGSVTAQYRFIRFSDHAGALTLKTPRP